MLTNVAERIAARRRIEELCQPPVDRSKKPAQLNHYRLEAGRFEENRGSGLKSYAHDFVIWKLSPPSSGSVPSCWRMYSMMASSVTFPLEATKYPRAQRWRPQNIF